MQFTKKNEITNNFASLLIVFIAIGLLFSGCSAAENNSNKNNSSKTYELPKFRTDLEDNFRYDTLQELADISSAVVILTPKNESFDKPFPAELGDETSAPTSFVKVHVEEILEGSIENIDTNGDIELVSPGIDQNTGELSLLDEGKFLAFITPGMYDKNVPTGGYVVTGGPNGLFGLENSEKPNLFTHTFSQGTSVPDQIDLTKVQLPKISNDEETLLREGPK